uniref:CHAT domain-containing protein n=1 Tax=Tahibacter caeni TaxID=1453545 RepID=UPI0021489738
LPPRSAPPPARLLLMLDDRLAAVPFAVLHWPDGRALVDTSTITLVPAGLRADSFVPLARPSRIDVLIAAAVGDRSGRLPALPRASDELSLVRGALAGVDVVGDAGAAFTRERLRTALEQPQSWLHVAAHGTNDARLQSYSGLWLPGSDRPVFVSWLDLVERPVRVDLLLLSACNLAGGIDRGVAGAANFATALSAAGAHHVVAALWPLSDSAGTEFTRAFYAGLGGADAPDPAAALLAAQRRLRASPHFRHPYYWSLFVHLQH